MTRESSLKNFLDSVFLDIQFTVVFTGAGVPNTHEQISGVCVFCSYFSKEEKIQARTGLVYMFSIGICSPEVVGPIFQQAV